MVKQPKLHRASYLSPSLSQTEKCQNISVRPSPNVKTIQTNPVHLSRIAVLSDNHVHHRTEQSNEKKRRSDAKELLRVVGVTNISTKEPLLEVAVWKEIVRSRVLTYILLLLDTFIIIINSLLR